LIGLKKSTDSVEIALKGAMDYGLNFAKNSQKKL